MQKARDQMNLQVHRVLNDITGVSGLRNRTSGEYEAVIDFDRVLRDPSQPARILPALDSRDHGHPTDAGYKALTDSIDLSLFSDDYR